jgi:hypothetical protein
MVSQDGGVPLVSQNWDGNAFDSQIFQDHLLPEERDELQRLVSTGKAAAYKRTRAQILLKADQGPDGPAWGDQQISEAFDVGRVTVERTRKALVLDGLPAALQRKKREQPPTPRKLDGSGEAQFIALACSEPPEGHSQWTFIGTDLRNPPPGFDHLTS